MFSVLQCIRVSPGFMSNECNSETVLVSHAHFTKIVTARLLQGNVVTGICLPQCHGTGRPPPDRQTPLYSQTPLYRQTDSIGRSPYRQASI